MLTVSFSPPTSTSSHTLSAGMDQQSPLAETLFSTLSSKPHTFLQPPQNLHASALAIAKHYLDPLANGVTDNQTQRQNEARNKRKRGQQSQDGSTLLKMRKVYVDGFAVDQVWEQARRVLDAAREEVERVLPAIEIEDEAVFSSEDDAATPRKNGVKMVRFNREGFEVSGSEEESAGDENDSEAELESGDESEGDADHDEHLSEDYDEEEQDQDLEDALDLSDDEEVEEEPAEEFFEDPNGLNDGFFSIDDFNKQTQLMEQRNPAELEDDEDEDDIDYFADPLAIGSAPPINGTSKRVADSEEEEDVEEDGGPTFGNMDLDAPEGASDIDEDGEEEDEDMEAENAMGIGNANNILYADFYAPPPKKAGKNKKKRGRPNPHNFPAGGQASAKVTNDGKEPDMKRTMAAVHRDLFSESDPDDDSDDALSDADPGDPKSRRSTHERRQAKIAEEIRRLESANVAKRSWTLSGEARATDRPLNSLLEEDLDFERAGKPVPVITAEISEDIEALIKRRILTQEFDELIRRRPSDLATGNAQKRGLADLPDTKSAKGLAEIYEEEHLARTDPSYVSAADAQTQVAHAEITALWKDVSSKLDALSSWHYRPKPAAPALEVRVDAPALSLEDARPTVGTEMGAAGSMLAPQEVYKPGAEKVGGEVVTRGGAPVAREEMAREDKARRRRREKERQKKAKHNESVTIRRDGTGTATAGDSLRSGKGKKGDEKAVVGTLKKAGVKVIGKKGELTNVDGSAVQGNARQSTGGSFKL